MASVVQRERSPYWTACFTSRDGRQLKRSTKTTDRNKALKIALELEGVEHQAREGFLTTTQLQKVLNDVAEQVTGDSLSVPSVETYLQDWLESLVKRNSPATKERYENTVTLFVEHLGPKSKQPVTSLTAKHFDEFVTARLGSGVAPKTASLDLKILNTAFRRAEAYGIILKNPVAAVRPPKPDSSERDIFTHEEVQRILDAAPSIEWQTLIMLGYFVGARLSDCVHMKWESIHAEQGVIIYQQKKTGKKVIVPMHYHVIEHLNYLAQFGWDPLESTCRHASLSIL